MNIAYAGNFLREGLKKAGHNIIEIPAGKTASISNFINDCPQQIDLAFLELYGSGIPIGDLENCQCELAAWCIDSPLNEFWLKDAGAIFDHIFVDQYSSLDAFAKVGLKAVWLPLCCQDYYFTPARKKEFDITFVGRINAHRPKRYNLLRQVSEGFNINVIQNVDLPQAQQIFAKSKIVLNENLFYGLTLRVLQGLSAGSLVATEKEFAGNGSIFKDGRELVDYSHENLLEKLNHFLHADMEREQIAARGKLACVNGHTSLARARDFQYALAAGTARNERLDNAGRSWHRLCSQYFFIQRFGGNMGTLIAEFEQFAKSGSDYAGDAMLMLGNIFTIFGKQAKAEENYRKAATLLDDYRPFLRLSMSRLNRGEISQAKTYMRLALKRIHNFHDWIDEQVLASLKDETGRLLYTAARLHASAGRIFDLGFQKNFNNPIADTAFEMARKLWLHAPSPHALDLMLGALEPFGLAGELLPEILACVEKKSLSEAQILKAADIAMRYYNIQAADKIISGLGKS